MGNYLVTISDSIFKGNHAGLGGAVDVVNTNLVVFTNNIFEDNRARPVPGYRNTPFSYKGGAINIQQEIKKGKCDKCKTLFNGTNVFKNNYAVNAGGAIAYLSEGFIDEGNQYTSNWAKVWNQTVTSYVT